MLKNVKLDSVAYRKSIFSSIQMSQESDVDVVERGDSFGEDNSVQREEDVREERHDDNPRPAQRARFLLYPHDEYVRETSPFRAFTEISISELEKDNAAFQRLNFRYIDVLILRLIVSNKQGQANIVQIQAGEISYHIVQLIPTNRSFLRRGSPLHLGHFSYFLNSTSRMFDGYCYSF